MQLTREEVFSKVAGVIANHFEIDPEKVTDQMSIKDDLNADSISVMEFVDEFGTEISDEDAEQIETVGGAVDYVYNRLNK